MRIKLVKVSSYNTSLMSQWEQYLDELKNFFGFWIKKKLGESATIQVIHHFSSDSIITVARLEVIKKLFSEDCDIVILLLDRKPTDFRSVSNAFAGLNWFWALYQPHPLGPYYNISRAMSHELLHIILRMQGKPKEIWVSQVDANAQIGNLPLDFWCKYPAQWLYGWLLSDKGYRRQHRRDKKTLFVTQNGTHY